MEKSSTMLRSKEEVRAFLRQMDSDTVLHRPMTDTLIEAVIKRMCPNMPEHLPTPAQGGRS